MSLSEQTDERLGASAPRPWPPFGPYALSFVLFVLLNVGRPLHLEADSVCYLLQAAAIRDHVPAGGWAGVELCGFPNGLPRLLAAFLQVPIALRWQVLTANALFLSVGAFVMHATLLREFPAGAAPAPWKVMLGFALSFAVARQLTPATSEPLYLVVSALALYSMVNLRDNGRFRLVWGVASLLLVASAIAVRSVGVALLAPLALASWSALSPWIRKHRVIAGAIAGVCALGLLLVAYRGSQYYLNVDVAVRYGGAEKLATAVRAAWYHLAELGELLTNLPRRKLAFVPTPVFGLAGAVLLAIGIWKVRIHSTLWTVMMSYTLAYSAIIAVWPFEDVRFWLPILPIIVFVIVCPVSTESVAQTPWIPRLVRVLPVPFVLAGLAGHAANTRRSFSKDWETTHYGQNPVGNVYRSAFMGAEDSTAANQRAVTVLRGIRR